jgi:hypothetical protein
MSQPFRPIAHAVAALLALTAFAWTQDATAQRRGDGPPPDRGAGARNAPPFQGMPQDRGRTPMDDRGRMPNRRDDGLSDSVRNVERTTRGQVLSAERVQSDGRDVNRIKIMDDRGRVRVYMDDPQSRQPTRDHDN